jgi:hypothetical protein
MQTEFLTAALATAICINKLFVQKYAVCAHIAGGLTQITARYLQIPAQKWDASQRDLPKDASPTLGCSRQYDNLGTTLLGLGA